MTSTTKVDRAVLFSQCEFFVDYRSSQTGCDRSLRLGQELESKYGAKIVEHPSNTTTTHIIFKNGNVETKLFAKKYNIPLLDPMWLEQSIRKRRLVKTDKYQIENDENIQPIDVFAFDRLAIASDDLPAPSTPKNKTNQLGNANVDSEKRTKKLLYTPVRGEFDQGNPHEYYDHQKRIITLDNLGMDLPDENHVLIHRYGCSVARRQIQEKPTPQKELKDEPINPIKYEELPTTISVPTESQSSPVVHFANAIRPGRKSPGLLPLSPSTTFDFDSQKQYNALGNRPQSTPLASPIVRRPLPTNVVEKEPPVEIPIEKIPAEKPCITPLKTADYSSFTRISPLHPTKSKVHFEVRLDEEDKQNDQEEINDPELPKPNEDDIPRPPPLLALSQAIRRKHPERLIDTKLNDQLPSMKDLPNAPANYSFVFYEFEPTLLVEAKRLARRMGDCFSFDTIDMTTTHVIIPEDDPQMRLTIDLLLALIYGCRIVTFEWLKCSSRVGEWLGVNKFEPKRLYQTHSSLNIYRKSRQQQKAIHLFKDCGLIYLTSIAKQRPLLLRLISFLGGNITVSRNLANIVVGRSSKALPIIIYPQVTEQWVIDSVKAGECLPADDYLVEKSTE
ncbi:unnamed protein product [Adineta ricciae]|uniref:BRCT domain-containing protein n=1 Tax=Adineta ricciae TaxID=249248 RepID=A0A814MJ94_ADIRI|nr:unnamed protein product [Adineta ricciae]